MADVDTSIYQLSPQSPVAAASGAIGLATGLQQYNLLQQAQQIRQYELRQDQANDIRSVIAPFVNDPNASRANVLGVAAQRARQMGYQPGVFEEATAPFANPNLSPQDFQRALKNSALTATGVPSILSRTTVMGDKGQTYAPPSQSLVGTNISTGTPFGASASPVAAATAGAGLESSATDTASQRFALNTLDRDLSVAGGKFGPTLPWEKKLNQLGARFGSTISMTPEELGAAESFDKVVTTLADGMSRSNGSDARLDAQFHSLPTSQGSAFGQSDIIKMLKGAGPDLTDAKRNVWFQYKKTHPGADFNQFNNDFNNEIDVRVFHLNNLEPSKRTAYLNSLPEADRTELAHKWADMYNDGVVVDGQKYKMPLIKRPTLGK